MKEITYEQQKKLIEQEFQSKMKVLEYARETEEMKHKWELERLRIKAAEIRKTQERKEKWTR